MFYYKALDVTTVDFVHLRVQIQKLTNQILKPKLYVWCKYEICFHINLVINLALNLIRHLYSYLSLEIRR